MTWVLVTGAAKRLGRAVAAHLAAQGFSPIVHHRDSSKEAAALVAELTAAGADCFAIAADLSDPTAARALLPRACAQAGAPIRALVNAAALFEHDTPRALDIDSFERQMRVNALAPSLLAQALAEAVEKAGGTGSIVNFLDFKLASPYPDHFSYTLAKYALAGATELMARGFAPALRVNAVAPGYILEAPGQSQERYRALHADTSLHYGPTPQDVAAAVHYLLTAPAVTGQTIYVDAGRRFRTHDRDLGFQ